jgi:hypothetical protein
MFNITFITFGRVSTCSPSFEFGEWALHGAGCDGAAKHGRGYPGGWGVGGGGEREREKFIDNQIDD